MFEKIIGRRLRNYLPMKYFALLFISTVSLAQSSKDVLDIKAIMTQQEADWNAGNLEAFMQGYWKSDSLMFIGSRGVNYGWQATLDSYKRGYPTREKMGELRFTILSIDMLSPTSAVVIGQWLLKRNEDAPNGHFMLLWKKVNGTWVIVADHSS
jgi:hypothetical protein